MSDYNYGTFSSREYDFESSEGPQVGQRAPDFELTLHDGRPARLLDFESACLVLELGSIPGPLFQSRRTGMAAIETAGLNVSSSVLYVREAHPGADIPSHETIEAKQGCARRLVEEDGEGRRVLVDGLAGEAHAAYGAMPNAVFIINRNGCVVFRAEWNNAAATRRALEALCAGRAVNAKSFFRPALPKTALHTLRRAGKGSAWDFLRSLPHLIWVNLIKRNFRLLINRPVAASRDTTC
jgi:hypothetical protein